MLAQTGALQADGWSQSSTVTGLYITPAPLLAPGSGGGLSVVANSGVVTVLDSTVAGNRAKESRVEPPWSGSEVVQNSTISANESILGNASGAGLSRLSDSFSLIHTTIVDNLGGHQFGLLFGGSSSIANKRTLSRAFRNAERKEASFTSCCCGRLSLRQNTKT